MSLWAEIQNQAAGNLKDEELALIYKYNEETEYPQMLDSGEYKNCKYTVNTNGYYPFIEIKMDPKFDRFSKFAGAGSVVFGSGKDKVEISRRFESGVGTFFTYAFNKEGDYSGGENGGRKYSIQEMMDIAKKFIDIILETELDITYMNDFEIIPENRKSWNDTVDWNYP